MHLLTVLGINNYTKTSYTWGDRQVETQFVAEALCEFFEVDRVTALLTAEAQAKHWESFHRQLSDGYASSGRMGADQIQFQSIPLGQSEAEIWQIFDAVVDAVRPGEQVIFDITNAFRSIPILVLLAAAFLQKARAVKIHGVYYGAFEVNRDAPPIIDLTPAVKLLDWLTATNQFIGTGSSIELSKLLNTLPQDFERSNLSEMSNIRPIRLKQMGKRIERISRSIDFLRPRDLMTEAAELQGFDAELLRAEVGAFAKPFELLIEQIQRDYGQFGLPDIDRADPNEVLQKQFLLLRWYVAKDLGTQAILLAREWVVSVLCVEQKLNYWDWRDRDQVERSLGAAIQTNSRSSMRSKSYPKPLVAFWQKLTKYRNVVAHTKTGAASTSAEELQTYVQQKLLGELTDLFPDRVL